MDEQYMALALELASKGEGTVNPNPMVGAVVVNGGEIVGTGYHKFYGGPHAEVYALEMAGEKSIGGTLYVTLEPCSHVGKTPPCVDRIIESKIKRCVVSMIDPNPLVSGKGIEKLKSAGIQVEIGILKEKSEFMNRVFLKYISTNIPYVFLKCGITLDGKIATRSGNSKWITNELSRKKVQELRHRYSGIVVGINTLIADNPSLNSRRENAVNPWRIVIDPNLQIPLNSKILEFEDGKNILISSDGNRFSEKAEFLSKNGVNMVFLPGKRFKIMDILKRLGELKIDSVIIEGGGNLIAQCFYENCIDGGEIFIAPKILGDSQGVPFVDGFKIENLEEAFTIKEPKFNIYGDNISIDFYSPIGRKE